MMQERLFLSLKSRNAVLEIFLQVFYGKGYGLKGERLAHMLGVGFLEAPGTEVTAEQRTKARGEGIRKAVGYFHHVLIFHLALSTADADEHKNAFHKAALSAEATCAVHDYGRIEYLLVDFHTEFLSEAYQSGYGAVMIFIVIKAVDEFVQVGHDMLT